VKWGVFIKGKLEKLKSSKEPLGQKSANLHESFLTLDKIKFVLKKMASRDLMGQ
jgi:hypothetical protein